MKVPKARKLPSGMWFIQLRLGGVSIPVTEKTEKKCRDAAALIKAEYAAGKKTTSRSSLTLKEASELFIANRSNSLSPSTKAGYERIKDNRFRSVSNKKLSEIKDWQGVCNAEAELCAPKTLENAWMFVKCVLKSQGITPPPVLLPKRAEKDLPWLDPEQTLAFISAARGRPGELPGLLALHSLRRSEILGLKWENVDLKSGVLHIKAARVEDRHGKLVYKDVTKSKTSQRTVRISIPNLSHILEERKATATGEYVIDCKTAHTMCQQINRICASAGLPLVGVHGLRRSFASLCYHLGVPVLETMRMGGWSDREVMFRFYTKLSETDKQNAESKFAVFFRENANEIANE